MKRGPQPAPDPPRFHAGQRVKPTVEGQQLLLLSPDVRGTVEGGVLVVRVRIDGQDVAQQYAPDFWEEA